MGNTQARFIVPYTLLRPSGEVEHPLTNRKKNECRLPSLQKRNAASYEQKMGVARTHPKFASPRN